MCHDEFEGWFRRTRKVETTHPEQQRPMDVTKRPDPAPAQQPSTPAPRVEAPEKLPA